jgi:hypothetical protein
MGMGTHWEGEVKCETLDTRHKHPQYPSNLSQLLNSRVPQGADQLGSSMTRGDILLQD